MAPFIPPPKCTLLCSPLPYYTKVVLCDQKHVIKVMGCVLRLDYKDSDFFLYCFLTEAHHCIIHVISIPLERPHGEKLKFDNKHVNDLGSRFSNLSQIFR